MNEKRIIENFEKYLTAVEKGLPGTLPSGANMESTRSQKPGSRSPHTSFAERFLSDPDNDAARDRFELALAYLRGECPGLYNAIEDRTAHPGKRQRLERVNDQKKHPYIAPFTKMAGTDATMLEMAYVKEENRRAISEHERKKAEWKRAKDEAPGWLGRHEDACKVVASFVLRWFDGEFSVNLDPDDVKTSTSKVQAAAQDREERQAAQNARARRKRYAEFLGTASGESKSDSVNDYAKMMGRAPSSVWEDVKFCEKNEWPDGRPVPVELRWEGSEEERGREGAA